jgi:inosose dehydratase
MKGWGYTGFECNVRFVQDQFANAAEARAQIEKTGVRFIGAHMGMGQAKPDSFPKSTAGAVSLGAECIVMSGSGLAIKSDFEAAVRAKADQLNALAKTCKENGLRLAYHNHNPEFANGNAEINGLAKYTDPELVSFLMDAGHGYLGGGNPAQFLSGNPKRIFGIHLKTFKGQEQMPLGQGDFGFEALAAAIKKTGWTGWLITEEGGGKKVNTAGVEPDRKYIKRVFGA